MGAWRISSKWGLDKPTPFPLIYLFTYGGGNLLVFCGRKPLAVGSGLFAIRAGSSASFYNSSFTK